MKKVVSILLCAVMLFSFACVFAFAEDAAPTETVTITFYDEDGRTVLDTVVVEKGKIMDKLACTDNLFNVMNDRLPVPVSMTETF